jgi:hypothetical protein
MMAMRVAEAIAETAGTRFPGQTSQSCCMVHRTAEQFLSSRYFPDGMN